MWLLMEEQLFRSKCVHHRIYTLPPCYCVPTFSLPNPHHREGTHLPVSHRLVTSGRSQYSWWKWRGQEPSWACGLPTLCVLSRTGMLMLYQLGV
jgi:hypothetical protein